MKILKKNQVIIYVIAIMIMTAGYLNYTTNINEEMIKANAGTEVNAKTETGKEIEEIGTEVNAETSIENNEKTENEEINKEIENGGNKIGEIGDATLVNSNDVIVTKNKEYFIKTKLERDNIYSQTIESYEKILNSTNSLETQKQIATKEIQNINQIKNSIMVCENLLKIKGFEESVVLLNKESVNVIIGKKELTNEECAQVKNIVSREMNAKIENIHISNK